MHLFDRLSDRDCKELALKVAQEMDLIDRIFCNSIGRSVFVKIYYKGRMKATIVSYFNADDSDEEVSNWNNIIMKEDYCLKNLHCRQ